MKIIKYIFVIVIMSAIFTQYIAVEGGLLKAVREKRQAQKELPDVSKVDTKLGVAYSQSAEPLQKLDIYSPMKKEKPVPILVHVHGGGWNIGDKSMMRNHGLFYASKGILFIALNYRLSPKVQHPAHVEDCAMALSWVFKHAAELGGDKNRIFLSGHSAGAHLAALLGTDSKYLQKHDLKPGMLAGVIPVDTASFNLLSSSNEKIVKNFVRQAFGTDEEILKSASPFYNVKEKAICPRFLIFNTSNRKSAAAGGKEFADKLISAGCDARFVVVDNHTHAEMSTGMYDASDSVGSAILKFILIENANFRN
jgi:arylformamidase